MEIGHATTGFLNHQYTRCGVPGIQIEFPKSIEPAARDITQIKRRRTRPPHSVGSQCDLMIEINVRVLVPLVTGEASRDKGFPKLCDLRNANRSFVEICSL